MRVGCGQPSSEVGDPYGAVCEGTCKECDNCVLDPLVPVCKEEMLHTTSPGGNVTLATLNIDPGYWRATQSSENILPCYYEDACLGGVTGAAGYCSEGYEGPCESLFLLLLLLLPLPLGGGCCRFCC